MSFSVAKYGDLVVKKLEVNIVYNADYVLLLFIFIES